MILLGMSEVLDFLIGGSIVLFLIFGLDSFR